MQAKYRYVLELSALLALLWGALTVIFGASLFIFATAIGSPSLGLGLGLGLFAVSFLASFVLFGLAGIVLVSIPRSWAILLGLLILVVGLILFQPELDILGLFGVLLGYMGPTMLGRRAGLNELSKRR